MNKLNCWEVNKCGMEKEGTCPASVLSVLDGIHGGTNAGRACWVVSGTRCKGQLQGAFTEKYKDCGTCDFYRMVREEEGSKFEMTISLLQLIQE